MNILVDIGHPAHVHYFRNAIKLLKKNGHKIKITARNRSIIKDLLRAYELDFVDRGEGSNSLVGKLLYMIKADLQLLNISRKFKPDLFLSFTTPYPAHVSYLLHKPHIALNDTEHVDKINALLTHPYCSVILTPKSYLNNLGQKQIRFNNLVEGLYLHKNYFRPDRDKIASLGLKEGEEYVILRFVSWTAHHDVGQKGIDDLTKRELIKRLEEKFRVFISSEGNLPEEFKPYSIKILPENMHDVLAYATLFIGESSTMATESALLGTQSVYINSLPIMCNIKLGEESGIIRHFRTSEGVISYIEDLISSKDLKKLSIQRSVHMQKDFIDATKFLVWFIENYPGSQIDYSNNEYYNNLAAN